MQDELNKLFRSYKLSETHIDLITRKLGYLTIKKNKIFQEGGTTPKKIGILISGLLTAYRSRSKDSVSHFFYLKNNPLVVDLDAFVKQKQSQLHIIATEESHLVTLSYNDLQALYEKIPHLREVTHFLVEDSYVRVRQALDIFQTKKAKERFKWFCSKHSYLLNRVSNKDMASFLNMGRDSITKFRKD